MYSFHNYYFLIKQPNQSEPEAPYNKDYIKGYFKLSRHYFRGLTYIFQKMNHSAVIIVEGYNYYT